MSTITTEMPVGQIVAQFPQTARVFEKYGIDYCCGGKLALGTYLVKRGLDAQVVLAELSGHGPGHDADPERDWTTASASELIRHILDTHHVYLREHLPRLSFLATKVARVHGENHPELIELAHVYAGFQLEMEQHMPKEEQILFPAILELEAGTGRFPVNHPISVMEAEHEAAGAALERMRELTNGFTPPEDACGSYNALFNGLAEMETDTFRHVHKENNILFPKALALLSGVPA